MEDIKAYIESGILELYVLGDVSPEEKLQVEAMAAKHPAIKAELDEIERSMEAYALENAVEPAEHMRDKILDSLISNLADDSTSENAPEENGAKVVTIERHKAYNFYKYAFAACLALLLASVAALVSTYNKLQQSNNQIASLQSANSQFAKTVNHVEGELEVYQNPFFRLLKLQGTAKSPQSEALVAWNPVSKKVWVDMHTLKVPSNDNAHQYQLWALVNGKPVDLGVFDKTADDTSHMKEMKSTAYADAFAVTLEPHGGSKSPTMDQMVVIGKF
ncbi:MAG TPA: anti-sigma factor [Mucilaginibacter sp.]|nr:anti-sigma factor [Mucilaginibacter sp.]